MRFKQLDLNLLVALDNLLALQSVSQAADRMNMSQSAMSNALTRLRTYFNDPLLVQVGRRMELTPRAEAMQAAIRDILVRVEATIETAPDFDPTQSTRAFHILLSDYTMTTLAPIVLNLAAQEGATVRFHFLPQIASPFVLLDQGEADLLIAPRVYCSADHPIENVYSDEFVCLVWKDGVHGGRELTPPRFEEAGHVVMVPTGQAQTVESQALLDMGIQRRVEVRSYSFSALPNLVVGNDRIATVHGHIARVAAQNLPVEIHPLPFDMPPMDQAMQWHAYRESDPGLTWLRDLFLRAGRLMGGG